MDTILHHELDKITEQTKRQNDLAKELYKFNISLNENSKLCYEYIHNINNKPLHEIINNIKSEYCLKHNIYYEVNDISDSFKINNDICV